jgi:hypothetical protein
MNESVELPEEAVRAFQMLARAPLPEGMEARLTAELRGRQMAHSQRAAARGGLWLPGTYALAAMALVLVAALLVNLRRSEQVQRGQIAWGAVPFSPAVGPVAPPKAVPHLVRTRHSMPRATEHPVREPNATQQVTPEFLNAPPLPLSAQERLLLKLAGSPRLRHAPALITRSEVMENHGVGRNAIFELDHQNPSPLQSTLQTSPIQGDLE